MQKLLTIYSKSHYSIIILVAIGMMAYFTPWLVIRNTVSLSMNAYELAEWSSLHPKTVIGPLGPWISLLLRLPLVSLTISLLSVLASNSRFTLVIAVIAFVGFLPPFEFFTTARSDPNYEQLLILGSIILGSNILINRVSRSRTRRFFVMLVALVGFIGSGLGQYFAYRQLQYFHLPATISLAGPIFTIAVATIIFNIQLAKSEFKTG